MGYYSAIKKNGILFSITWIKLEGIILSEKRQRKTNIYVVNYQLYIKSKYWNKLVSITTRTKKKQTHGYKAQATIYQWEQGKGQEQHRGIKRYKLLYIT